MMMILVGRFEYVLLSPVDLRVYSGCLIRLFSRKDVGFLNLKGAITNGFSNNIPFFHVTRRPRSR